MSVTKSDSDNDRAMVHDNDKLRPPAASTPCTMDSPAVVYRTWSSYDTIRDAILTCNQKQTLVSLIYRTEPTQRKQHYPVAHDDAMTSLEVMAPVIWKQ